ncbi:MAG: glycosyltransferase [Patescibacteria group bacterium]
MKLLTVGRIAPVKNYDILIRAAKLLTIDFSVTVVGEAALEEDKAYEQRIRAEGGFHFVGKKNHRELPDIYRSHDLFVHMSGTGSLDKTLLEAMACGMKVLSCNDAAKAFLPSELIFENADDLANKIQNYHTNFDGRTYVLEHHDLKKLIAHISSLL